MIVKMGIFYSNYFVSMDAWLYEVNIIKTT